MQASFFKSLNIYERGTPLYAFEIPFENSIFSRVKALGLAIMSELEDKGHTKSISV